MLAFLSEWEGIKGIMFNTDAAKARYASYRAAREAGYGPQLVDIKITRAPEYDNHVDPMRGKPEKHRCYVIDYLVKPSEDE